METITHAVQNASNAFWNEVESLRAGGQQQQTQTPGLRQEDQPHGEEPLSGVQGKGTATDPYDSGNLEEQPRDVEPLSGIQGKGTVSDPYDAGNRDEQPGAPSSKDNTPVMTEPLAVNAGLPESHTIHQDKDQNPAIDHPTLEQSPKFTSPGNVAGRSTLKDEPITGASTTAEAPVDETIATSTPAAAASTFTATTNDRPSEQRTEFATSQSKEGTETGESSGTATATEHRKQKVSEESLKGPQCPPREPYEFEKKLDNRGKKAEEQRKEQLTTAKAEGGSGDKTHGHHGLGHGHGHGNNDSGSSSGNPAKESEEHHHKTIKERLSKVVRVGHHH